MRVPNPFPIDRKTAKLDHLSVLDGIYAESRERTKEELKIVDELMRAHHFNHRLIDNGGFLLVSQAKRELGTRTPGQSVLERQATQVEAP